MRCLREIYVSGNANYIRIHRLIINLNIIVNYTHSGIDFSNLIWRNRKIWRAMPK